MARQRLTYRERDLNAAIKIAQERGIKIGRIRIDKDGVSIELARDDVAEAEGDEDWDAVRARIRNTPAKDL
jgi:hypothetical protein